MALNTNTSGFTLVELVIGLSISSLVILGGANVIQSSSKSSQATNKRSDSSEYFDDIAKNINNRITCSESLLNLQVGATIPNIKKNNVNLYTINQTLASKAILTSMVLEQSPNWVPVARGFGPASLKITVSDNGKNITKYFPISVQLNDLKKVSSCSQKLELATVDNDIYVDVCKDVVGGYLSGSKCRWTKPVVTIVTYIPAPPPPAPNPPPSPPPGVYDPNVCTGPVCGLYETYLGRPPELGGYLFWNEVLANGATIEQVAASISGSREARGEPVTAQENADYAAGVARYGLTLDQAHGTCGGNISCQ